MSDGDAAVQDGVVAADETQAKLGAATCLCDITLCCSGLSPGTVIA